MKKISFMLSLSLLIPSFFSGEAFAECKPCKSKKIKKTSSVKKTIKKQPIKKIANKKDVSVSSPVAEKKSQNAVISISSESEFKKILASDKPVVVDVYASWCGPCKRVAPIVEQFAQKRDDIIVVKVDGDKNKFITKYGVRSFPTFLYFKDGKKVGVTVGATNLSGLENNVKQKLSI